MSDNRSWGEIETLTYEGKKGIYFKKTKRVEIAQSGNCKITRRKLHIARSIREQQKRATKMKTEKKTDRQGALKITDSRQIGTHKLCFPRHSP